MNDTNDDVMQMSVLPKEPIILDEKSFWWTVDFSMDAKNEGERAFAEEQLFNLAVISGSIGSELAGDDDKKEADKDKVILHTHYRGVDDLTALVAELQGYLADFQGVAIHGCYKTENRDWNKNFVESFPPLRVGHSFVVMAPWHKEECKEKRIPLYIYPSSAFGTGYHESTRIALMLLEDVVKRGDTVLDIGAGTGILFMAALKLGAARAIARDLDPATIAEMRRNMNLNGLDFGLCDMDVGDLLNGIDVKGNVLIANILLTPNLALLPSVRRVLKPKGRAIFSGMTGMERSTFLSVLTSAGLEVEKELHFGGWWGCRAKIAWGL